MEVRVEVDGLPPKKDGSTSMWRKRTEMPRIAALRRAVSAKMSGGLFEGSVALELEMHLPAGDLFRAGDLDNFVTGVFDSLMAAKGIASDDGAYLTAEWAGIHPQQAVALEDDARIVSLVASKSANAGVSRYTLILKDLGSDG